MPATAAPPVSDPVDTPHCDAGVAWTTGNVAEAFPGVFTALGFGFTGEPMELAFRTMFHRLGVFGADELVVPERVEDRFWSAFSGRAAANLEVFRRVAGRIPGTSANAVEQQLFGYVRDGLVDDDRWHRYPYIALRAPRSLATLPRRHDAMSARLRGYRREQLARVPRLDERGCLELLLDSRERFGAILVEHLVVAFVSSGLADRLGDVLAGAGAEDLRASLLSGVGSDENEVAHDLWSLAHGDLDLAAFLDRHGYHGPNEGQLHGVSWREDPAPVLARLDDYRAVAADDPRAPRARSAEQVRRRTEAAAELGRRTGRVRGRVLRRLVDLTARYLSLREQGKAAYLMALDVARASARRLGEHLAAREVIAVPSDVFHLTLDELASPATDLRATADARRARYVERVGLRLPRGWEGLPEVTAAPADATDDAPVGTVLSGVAASGGVVEGVVRVVRDPGTAEIADGDVLVCETTDPGWTSLFLVAGALVTDFGGLLGHGPIVARELGLPCVCGTGDASARLRDGQRVRVDGDRGAVEVLG